MVNLMMMMLLMLLLLMMMTVLVVMMMVMMFRLMLMVVMMDDDLDGSLGSEGCEGDCGINLRDDDAGRLVVICDRADDRVEMRRVCVGHGAGGWNTGL